MRYRSKPTTVEAIQWDGTKSAYHEMDDAGMRVQVLWVGMQYDLAVWAGVDGAQGFVPVPIGHWVVRAEGVLNDHWPVEDAYFREKYAPVLDEPATRKDDHDDRQDTP